MDSKKILEIAVKASKSKQGENLVALNMTKVSLITDYFLISDATSARQVQAIANSVEDSIEENGIAIKRIEGFIDARWVLIDLGDVMVHVFQKEVRSYYNLEKLWVEAPIVKVSEWI